MPAAAELYYSLYREKEKDALPVVLLHGAAGNHLSWGVDIRRLRNYQVFALDLPGHGKSAGRDGQQTIDGYVQAVVGWMDALGLRRAVFVGHSMGGAIALGLGIHYPGRVLGLGLVSTGVRLKVHPDLLELASRPETFYKAIDMLATHSFGPKTPPRLVELVSKRMAETRLSVLHGDLLACTNFDVKDQVLALHCPVLVVGGTQDVMTPLRYAQFMADTIPGARLQVILDAGHMVILEKPAEVAAALDQFLRKIVYFHGEEV
jgi:pimeloyl-ACP methyl ester carboxylesterase